MGKFINAAFIVHALCDGVWRLEEVICVFQGMVECFEFGSVEMGMGLVFK
jgi:hypothetical protein